MVSCVVILGAISQYSIYRYSIHRTTDDVLQEYKLDIEKFVSEYDSLPSLQSVVLYTNRHYLALLFL